MKTLTMLVAITTALVLSTGCTKITPGSAVAGSDRSPLHPLVTADTLASLLLNPTEVNDTLNATGMVLNESVHRPVDASKTVESACLGVMGPLQAEVYADSGWTNMQGKVFQEPGTDHDHFLSEAVVRFPAPSDAENFLTSSTKQWQGCANHRYSYQTPEGGRAWMVGEVTVKDEVLTTVKTQDGTGGWACQRGLSTGSNVVVDISVCGQPLAHDLAITVVHNILAKLPLR